VPASNASRSADSLPELRRAFGALANAYPDSQDVNMASSALAIVQSGTGPAATFVGKQHAAGVFDSHAGATTFATLFVRSSGTYSAAVMEKNTNGGSALVATNNANGGAGFFNTRGGGTAVQALAEGTGVAIIGDQFGASGDASRFYIASTSNPGTVVRATTNGRGRAGYFEVKNSTYGSEAMRIISNGPGSTMYVQRLSSGAGSAAVIQSTSFQATGAALLVNSAGTGFAAAINAAGAGGGLKITTAGGPGLQVVGGAKNAVVATSSGARALYSEEATEVWFTDYGFGRLTSGRSRVTLDRTFAETVALDRAYHVFLQSYGDAELVVRNRSATGFDVVRRDGLEDAEFSYRIVARRRGFERTRLGRAPWADTVVRSTRGLR